MNSNVHELDNAARLARENTWLGAVVAEKDKASWHRLDHTHAYTCHMGKRFFVWKKRSSGEVVIVEVYSVKEIKIDHNGPVMVLEKSQHAGRLTVTHKPRPFLLDDLFIWFPAMFDTRYAPRDYDESDPRHRRLTWKICVRGGNNPHQQIREDRAYFSDTKEFRQLWPDVGI